MQRLVAFDDGRGQLAPLTDLRASFEVRTGALTTLERLQAAMPVRLAALWVPEGLRGVVRPRHAVPVNSDFAGDEPVTLINGRSVLPPEGARGLQPGEALLEAGSGDIVAARMDVKSARAFLRGEAPAWKTTRTTSGACLMSRPWDVRRWRDEAIAMDLRLLLSPAEQPGDPATEPELFEDTPGAVVRGGAEALRLGGQPIRVDPRARVLPGSILDAEKGPIVIAQHAIVRPGAILIGPCYVGPHAQVLERATIRPNTAIGPWCKVNGEIGGVIFQGFSNKAHDGYLGDSYVGEWVNLGAGTTNSNLLNTYGEIVARATPGGKHERTGQTFLGAIIGDHVKTAISTRLMTGCVLHTGGMFATTAAVQGCTPRFCWCTDEGEREYRVEKFVEVMRAAMARRQIEPNEPYVQRVRSLAENKQA